MRRTPPNELNCFLNQLGIELLNCLSILCTPYSGKLVLDVSQRHVLSALKPVKHISCSFQIRGAPLVHLDPLVGLIIPRSRVLGLLSNLDLPRPHLLGQHAQLAFSDLTQIHPFTFLPLYYSPYHRYARALFFPPLGWRTSEGKYVEGHERRYPGMVSHPAMDG